MKTRTIGQLVLLLGVLLLAYGAAPALGLSGVSVCTQYQYNGGSVNGPLLGAGPSATWPFGAFTWTGNSQFPAAVYSGSVPTPSGDLPIVSSCIYYGTVNVSGTSTVITSTTCNNSQTGTVEQGTTSTTSTGFFGCFTTTASYTVGTTSGSASLTTTSTSAASSSATGGAGSGGTPSPEAVNAQFVLGGLVLIGAGIVMNRKR